MIDSRVMEDLLIDRDGLGERILVWMGTRPGSFVNEVW